MNQRVHIAVRGAVQGVGFRPFIYRLASDMGLIRLGAQLTARSFHRSGGNQKSLGRICSAHRKGTAAALFHSES